MSEFKVMTWNLENLKGPGPKEDARLVALYQEKLDGLKQVISEVDPHVIAVQEVLDPKAFDDLAAKLDGCYSHKLLAAPDGRGIRVGFLSKLAFEEKEEISIFPEESLKDVPGINGEGEPVKVKEFGRNALRILVRPRQDFPINLIAVHLKSKLITYPIKNGRPRFAPGNERARAAGLALLKRTAEAVALRVKANQILIKKPHEALIILGDCNDVASAATTQILQGPSGSEVPDIDGSGNAHAFNAPDKGDAVRLFNLAARIPRENRYSRINNGNKELIDHIFVSEEMLPGRPRRLPIVDSRVHYMGGLDSVTDDPRERSGVPCSDHAPVMAVFEI